MKKQISFKLNGEKRSLDIDPSEVLLEVLRDKLGVKSTKCGCERGDCGTCTVMINGRTVRSCMILAIEVDGQSVVTLEGLMKDDLTLLQKKFIEHNSFQCGYCTPGVIMSATELLNSNPKPSTEEIKEALGGNLCRCTGYSSIINAIKDIVNED
ncbi:(2Fe-2S)-binding protein [Bacteroidota bacterium]